MRRPKRPVNGILLLDKPAGITSNAALQHVKRLYQAGKAGHTGSLDPIATGLLPICLGEATKLSGLLLEGDKRYVVRARLGEKTTTGDCEGSVLARSDPAGLRREQLEAALARFVGRVQQVPPMYSALKREGRPLYQLARAGIEVERQPREVEVRELRLLEFGRGEVLLSVACSKGTYVRTLIEDIATALGQYAHVAELRRTGAEPFGESGMTTLEQLEHAARVGMEALDRLLLPPVAAVQGRPQVRVDPARAGFLAHGQAVRVAGAPRSGVVAIVDDAGDLLGLAEPLPDGSLAPRRWLAVPGPGA